MPSSLIASGFYSCAFPSTLLGSGTQLPFSAQGAMPSSWIKYSEGFFSFRGSLLEGAAETTPASPEPLLLSGFFHVPEHTAARSGGDSV